LSCEEPCVKQQRGWTAFLKGRERKRERERERERGREREREKCRRIVSDRPGVLGIGTSLKDQSAAAVSRRTDAVKSFLRGPILEVPFPASCIDFRKLLELESESAREKEKERAERIFAYCIPPLSR